MIYFEQDNRDECILIINVQLYKQSKYTYNKIIRHL